MPLTGNVHFVRHFYAFFLGRFFSVVIALISISVGLFMGFSVAIFWCAKFSMHETRSFDEFCSFCSRNCKKSLQIGKFAYSFFIVLNNSFHSKHFIV